MSMLTRDARVYVAGHRGMVGSAVWRALEAQGFTDLVGWSSAEYVVSLRCLIHAFPPTDNSEIPLDALRLMADFKLDPRKFPFV